MPKINFDNPGGILTSRQGMKLRNEICEIQTFKKSGFAKNLLCYLLIWSQENYFYCYEKSVRKYIGI